MSLAVTLDSRGVARVRLDRPARHNAFDAGVIALLTAAFDTLSVDAAVKAVVLSGNGPSFCAGADAGWMRAAAGLTEAENRADAMLLSDMLAAVDTCAKPVVCIAHGNVFGGGVGLVACADMVVVRPDVRFRLSEVRLGLIPATIGPFVVGKIGAGAARRWFLTAEDFGAVDAVAMGLAHVVSDDPEAQVTRWVDALALGAPGAVADTKRLIAAIAGHPVDDALRADTAARIAARRASAEGKEGLTAFAEKRQPNWATL